MTEPDYIMPELMPKDFEDGKPTSAKAKGNTFFWLGDPHNRYMTREEYDEAVLSFRSKNEETNAEHTDPEHPVAGVVRTISRQVRTDD